MVPHTQPPTWPTGIPPSRLAAALHLLPVGCRVGLLGVPDDTGVRLNHGRAGAAGGPAAFRAALARYGVAEPAGVRFPRVFDAGDVQPAPGHDRAAAEATHDRVTAAADALHELGLVPIMIGGGHDLTYPFVRAAAARFARPGVLYFDAHLDVRDTFGSGMPFRRLVDDCGIKSLACVGADPFANSAEHVKWFEAHGGCLAPDLPAALRHLSGCTDLAVSFDLDCLDASHAPGVSAHNPAGLRVGDAAAMVRAACADPRVRCFDVMELCPPHDHDARTARAAAFVFLSALAGLGERADIGRVG